MPYWRREKIYGFYPAATDVYDNPQLRNWRTLDYAERVYAQVSDPNFSIKSRPGVSRPGQTKEKTPSPEPAPPKSPAPPTTSKVAVYGGSRQLLQRSKSAFPRSTVAADSHDSESRLRPTSAKVDSKLAKAPSQKPFDINEATMSYNWERVKRQQSAKPDRQTDFESNRVHSAPAAPGTDSPKVAAAIEEGRPATADRNTPVQSASLAFRRQVPAATPIVVELPDSTKPKYLHAREMHKVYETGVRRFGWKYEVHRDPLQLKQYSRRIPYNVTVETPIPKPPDVKKHYNDPNTFFYNTIPQAKTSCIVAPDWKSERFDKEARRIAVEKRKQNLFRYADMSFIY